MRACVALLYFGLLAGCAPKMDRDELFAMITRPEHGLMAGVALGDTWESVKAKHDPKLRVRDDATSSGPIRQLRFDVGKPMEDDLYITYTVDAAGVITGMALTVNGAKDNSIVVRALYDNLLKHYEKKLGPPKGCETGACLFDVDGKPGGFALGFHKSDGSSSMIDARTTR